MEGGAGGAGAGDAGGGGVRLVDGGVCGGRGEGWRRSWQGGGCRFRRWHSGDGEHVTERVAHAGDEADEVGWDLFCAGRSKGGLSS